MHKQIADRSPSLTRAIPAANALLDLIENALLQDRPINEIEMIMGFAREEGIAELVFHRTMEDLAPSWDVLVRMVGMIGSQKAYLDLLAFAQARGESDELDLVFARLGLLH